MVIRPPDPRTVSGVWFDRTTVWVSGRPSGRRLRLQPYRTLAGLLALGSLRSISAIPARAAGARAVRTRILGAPARNRPDANPTDVPTMTCKVSSERWRTARFASSIAPRVVAAASGSRALTSFATPVTVSTAWRTWRAAVCSCCRDDVALMARFLREKRRTARGGDPSRPCEEGGAPGHKRPPRVGFVVGHKV